MKTQCTLHNKFEIIASDTNTGDVKRAWAYNVITNTGLTRARNRETFSSYIHIGTGDGTPSASDTSLFAGTVYKSTTVDAKTWDKATNTLAIRFRIKFDETEQNGKNFTEIGLAYSSSNSSLCTHAMIVDEHGEPMVVEKTDTIILTVYATLYVRIETPEATKYFSSIAFSDTVFRHLTLTSRNSAKLAIRQYGPLGGSFIGRSTHYRVSPEFSKAFTFANTGTGFTMSADILGSESNNVLIRSIGLMDDDSYSDTATGLDLYTQDYADLGIARTTIDNLVVGTGDDVTTVFYPDTELMLLNTEKLKVKVDGTEVPFTPIKIKPFEGITCGNSRYNSPGVRLFNNKYYCTTSQGVTSSARSISLYKSDTMGYTEADLIGTTWPLNMSPDLYQNYFAIVPTYLPDVFVLCHFSSASSYSADNFIYMIRLDSATKQFSSLQKIKASKGSTYISMSDDMKFFVAEGNIYYINQSGNATSIGTGHNIIGDIAINSSSNAIYKLGESDGTGTMTSIGSFARQSTGEIAQYKRLDTPNMYAVVSIPVLSTNMTDSNANVTIIDSSTSKVTSETYKVVNPSYAYNANATSTIYPISYKYGTHNYDFMPDLENKIVFLHAITNRSFGGSSSTYGIDCMPTNGNKAIVYCADIWVELDKPKEYVIGVKLETPAASGKTVTISGERDGFLKTTDYKLSYKMEIAINA